MTANEITFSIQCLILLKDYEQFPEHEPEQFIKDIPSMYGLEGEHALIGFVTWMHSDNSNKEEAREVLIHDVNTYRHTEPLMLRYSSYAHEDERITVIIHTLHPDNVVVEEEVPRYIRHAHEKRPPTI